MSPIRKKSEQNQSAGTLLLNKNFYASSIHCFYYACIQLIKFIFIEKYRKSESEMNEERGDNSFHNWILNEFKNRYELKDSSKAAIIHQKLLKLKRYRIDADYKNIDINITKSRKAEKLSLEIIDNLKKDYEL